jgi:tRNA threonylcarbamoyladenosine biosynthesis protein TsaB
MIILSLKTDQEMAEISLHDGQTQLAEIKWQAHRELSTTLFTKIDELLASQSKHLKDVQGIVCFEGPGSFTGLRIGLTAANALAYALGLPIVARQGDDWLLDGIKALESGEDQKVAIPFYGSEAHITQQKR